MLYLVWLNSLYSFSAGASIPLRQLCIYPRYFRFPLCFRKNVSHSEEHFLDFTFSHKIFRFHVLNAPDSVSIFRRCYTKHSECRPSTVVLFSAETLSIELGLSLPAEAQFCDQSKTVIFVGIGLATV